jgi:diacylglycerol kinase family enzyme
MVLASNMIHYAGYVKLARSRKLDDGLYEVYLFRRGSGLAMLPYGVRGLLGRLPGGSCTMVRAHSIKVTSSEPVPYQVDGDFRGVTPVEIEVTGRQVQVLVPRNFS